MKLPDAPWKRWSLALAISALALGAAEAAVWLGAGRDPLSEPSGRAFAGAWLAAWLFLGGLALLRLLLKLEWAPLSVARTLLDEAIRMRLALAFIGLLILILAVLPAMESPETPLHYRVQTFLSLGLGATATLLSLMTIFLSCIGLSGEIQDQRIFTVMTKPMGRGAYLFGKWLGIMLLDGLLLAVAGASLFSYAFQMAREPGIDRADAQAVWSEVLTARASVQPRPAAPFEAKAREKLAQLIQERSPLLQQYGEDKLFDEMVKDEEKQWRSIEPRGRATFVFEGLHEAKALEKPVQIRFTLNTLPPPPDNLLILGMQVKGRTAAVEMRVGEYTSVTLSPEAIDGQGRIELMLINENPRNPKSSFAATITIPPVDGLEALYERGGFALNFARATAILWIKLGFLAMFGLGAGALLSFHVAALLTLGIYTLASASGFLIDALKYFGDNEKSEALKAATSSVRWTGMLLAELLGPYSRYAPGPKVVDGRLVPWSDVLGCAGWIGLVWTGLAAAAGWLIFRLRELARVQV